MENTLENKEKFFGLYAAQETLRFWGQKESCKVVSADAYDPLSYLELKNLSDISDEEAVEAIRKYYKNPSGIYQSEWAKKNVWAFDNTEVSDYLRSRGFLLPFHDLTPDQIISYGWCRYAEPK